MMILKLPQKIDGNTLTNVIETSLIELGCKLKTKEDYGILLYKKEGIVSSKSIEFKKEKEQSSLSKIFFNNYIIYSGKFEKIYMDTNYKDIMLNLYIGYRPIDDINKSICHAQDFIKFNEFLERLNNNLNNIKKL